MEKIDSVISNLLSNLRPKYKEYEKLEKIARVWNKICGKAIACHTKVVNLNNGVLKINVDSPTFLFDLKFKELALRGKLIGRLKTEKIEKIIFRVADITK